MARLSAKVIGALAPTHGLTLLGLLLGGVGCKKLGVPASSDDSRPLAVNELASEYEPKLSVPTSQSGAVSLEGNDQLLDIRGVGDSAWSGLRAAVAPKSEFGSTLKKFDPTGKILRGDLNFINWESAVGRGCSSYFNVDYAFCRIRRLLWMLISTDLIFLGSQTTTQRIAELVAIPKRT